MNTYYPLTENPIKCEIISNDNEFIKYMKKRIDEDLEFQKMCNNKLKEVNIIPQRPSTFEVLQEFTHELK